MLLSFKELEERLPAVIKGSVESGERISFELISAPGLGKSSLVKQLRKILSDMNG